MVKGVKDAVKSGIDIYATSGTIKGFKFDHHRFNAVKKGGIYKLGPFDVIAFDTHHDVNEPCGFLIKHPEMGTTLFLTDTIYCNYQFTGLNNILIEANYSQDIIDEKLSGNRFLRNRVIQSHMSVETCLETLQANDLRAVNNIVLIHLSDRNSDAKVFKQRIEDETLKTVTIATAGLTIDNYFFNSIQTMVIKLKSFDRPCSSIDINTRLNSILYTFAMVAMFMRN